MVEESLAYLQHDFTFQGTRNIHSFDFSTKSTGDRMDIYEAVVPVRRFLLSFHFPNLIK
jgi:hypothetical protein